MRCFLLFLMWKLWSESDSYCVAGWDVLRIRKGLGFYLFTLALVLTKEREMC